MRISEIFYSIQGEGLLSGVPSVFVRTSGCNLRCRWCDTWYASWEPEGPEMSLDEIEAEVGRYPSSAHCVITGGEPMVAKDIRELCARLRAAGRHITIETAGTVAPEGIACDLASLSPKLAHSTPHEGEIAPAWISRHEERRLQPGILREWVAHYPYQLKFVVSTKDDLAEIQEVVTSIGTEIPPDRVLLMPEGITNEALKEHEIAVTELCKTTGYRFCPRLHIGLFGNTRGT